MVTRELIFNYKIILLETNHNKTRVDGVSISYPLRNPSRMYKTKNDYLNHSRNPKSIYNKKYITRGKKIPL